jgi:hypothetical protein
MPFAPPDQERIKPQLPRMSLLTRDDDSLAIERLKHFFTDFDLYHIAGYMGEIDVFYSSGPLCFNSLGL